MDDTVAGATCTGPAWSIKMNGPTIRRKRKGRMRFTSMPGASAAFLASITMSIIASIFNWKEEQVINLKRNSATEIQFANRAMIDLRFNYPALDEEAAILQTFFTSAAFANNNYLRFPPYEGLKENHELLSRHLQIEHLHPHIVAIVPCTSGNHAITLCLEWASAVTSSLLCEPFTYQAFKHIAAKRNLSIVPLETDENGVTVESIEKNARTSGAKVLYLQPTIQNPTTLVMPTFRRQQIAEIAEQLDLFIVEDDAYRFLHPSPPKPFMELIPDRTVHIYSLSKPFNALIKMTYLILPKRMKTIFIDNVRLTSSGTSSLLTGLTTFVLQNNLLSGIIERKRVRARLLKEQLLSSLTECRYSTFETGFHLWLTLPEGVNDVKLTHDLEQVGVGITAGSDFAITPSNISAQHVRVALGGENDIQRLKAGVKKINELISTNAKQRRTELN
jgi:DNA-binding transcriptional MocR family regulator